MTFGVTFTSLLLWALGLDIVLKKFLVVELKYGINVLGCKLYLEGSEYGLMILS